MVALSVVFFILLTVSSMAFSVCDQFMSLTFRVDVVVSPMFCISTATSFILPSTMPSLRFSSSISGISPRASSLRAAYASVSFCVTTS